MKNGVLAGYPMLDVKATLIDGSFHDVDSNEMAFKIAASMGFREGALKADASMLEPMMKVEVVLLKIRWVMLWATLTVVVV